MARCVIFCAGAFDGLAAPLQPEDYLLAADGGFAHLEKLGLTANEVLGDFDSLGYTPTGATTYPVEKNDTDAMLAVRRGLSLGYKTFLLYGGMEGSRPDHTVANLQTLQFLADNGATGCLIGKNFVATVVKNGTISFQAGTQGTLSLFCLGADATGVTLKGLYYPLRNATLTAGFPLGISNHFTGAAAKISVEHGSLLVFFERKNYSLFKTLPFLTGESNFVIS